MPSILSLLRSPCWRCVWPVRLAREGSNKTNKGLGSLADRVQLAAQNWSNINEREGWWADLAYIRRKPAMWNWNNVIKREGWRADLALFPIRASHGSRAVDSAMKEAGGTKMTVRRPGQIAWALTQKERTWTKFWKPNQRMTICAFPAICAFPGTLFCPCFN